MTQIYKDLVTFFGGQRPTASKLCVSQGTVSGWVRGIHGCSAEVALLAEKITLGKFTAVHLRPSLCSISSRLIVTVDRESDADKRPGSAVNSSSNGAF